MLVVILDAEGCCRGMPNEHRPRLVWNTGREMRYDGDDVTAEALNSNQGRNGLLVYQEMTVTFVIVYQMRGCVAINHIHYINFSLWPSDCNVGFHVSELTSTGYLPLRTIAISAISDDYQEAVDPLPLPIRHGPSLYQLYIGKSSCNAEASIQVLLFNLWLNLTTKHIKAHSSHSQPSCIRRSISTRRGV